MHASILTTCYLFYGGGGDFLEEYLKSPIPPLISLSLRLSFFSFKYSCPDSQIKATFVFLEKETSSFLLNIIKQSFLFDLFKNFRSKTCQYDQLTKVRVAPHSSLLR